MTRKSRGFTLIELLVVIAIIAILAAMLFPVFARARESARKIQCLSNVKNIAMAFQMYLGDYEMFPPSAKMPGFAKNIIPTAGDWFSAWKNGGWYCNCGYTWPVGWGGTVTDCNQNNDWCTMGSADTGAVEIDLATNEGNRGTKLSAIGDPVKFIVTADAVHPNAWAIEQVAFADLCRAKWGDNVDGECGAQWENCSDTVSCGLSLAATQRFWTDASYRKQYARHMGGSNLGFLDGHAAWWAADALIAGAGNSQNPHPQLDGFDCQCLPANWTGPISPST
jgi:prepilin-type N-terminal cleavage/methylation domain-containing protein/prepilin-type processing-associated H-X9-DG protein